MREGQKNLSPNNCKSIGIEVAKMHDLTKNFKLKRENDLSIKSWRNLFDAVKDKCSEIHGDLPKLIEENLNSVEIIGPKVYQKELFMLICFMIIFFLNKIV